MRAVLPRLVSGSLEVGATSSDLKTDFGMTNDPDPFIEFWAEWYIDRLGIRLRLEEDNTFQGRLGKEGILPPGDVVRSSELETNTAAIGLDLDLIRYPFLRLGIDYDLYFGKIKLHDRRAADATLWTAFDVRRSQPMTIGVHGLAIPTRIRGVPLTFQGRARFPVPFVTTSRDAKLIEWEISGGLRPAIWETSNYTHSTISVGLYGGFKSVSLEAEVLSGFNREGTLKARWQGAYIELGLAF